MHAGCDRNILLLHMPAMSVVRNQRGSVLLVVFTVAVVLAAVMPSMYYLILSSSKSQVKRGDMEAYVAMIHSLRSQLEDPLQCHQMLGGMTVPTSYGARINNVVIPWRYSTSTETHLKRGWKVPGTVFTISDVVMVRSGASGGTVGLKTPAGKFEHTVVPLRVYVYPKEVGLNFADQSSGTPDAPELLRPMIRRDLMIRVLANVGPDGRIFNCFGQQSIAGACQANGGGYNHLGPADMKCQPWDTCFTAKVGVTTDPNQCALASSIPFKALQITQPGFFTKYICQLCFRDL